MNKLTKIPLRYSVTIMVLLLLYALIINVELQMGSQRYTLIVSGPTTPHSGRECVEKLAAIDEQILIERTADDNTSVEREKMNVLVKWFKCGVL